MLRAVGLRGVLRVHLCNRFDAGVLVPLPGVTERRDQERRVDDRQRADLDHAPARGQAHA